MGLILTAGYHRSPSALAIAELLKRQGTRLSKVIVCSTLSPRRLRDFIRQRGWKATLSLGQKLRGSSKPPRSRVLDEALQAFEIKRQSLKKWCSINEVEYYVVPSLNSHRCLTLLSGTDIHGVIYSGGGILGQRFLNAVEGRVLNAHAGKLPEVRGMNACEWSVLLDIQPTVTIHYIDRGIDTGQTVEIVPVKPAPQDTLDDLRERCVLAGVEGLVRHATSLQAMPFPETDCHAAAFRQCYILAPVMRELVENIWQAKSNSYQPT